MIKAARFQIEALTIIDAIYTLCNPSLDLYWYIILMHFMAFGSPPVAKCYT